MARLLLDEEGVGDGKGEDEFGWDGRIELDELADGI